MSEPFEPFAEKMRADGLPPVAIETFRHYYEQLRAGATGTLSEEEIAPLEDVPRLDQIEHHREAGRRALERTVVVKLNGGLGTSMGMTQAKSLLVVKEGLSFLDVIARQVLHLRREHGCRLPLVLMNSFRTRDDSLAALARHPELASDVPADFLQHRVPRIRADDLTPVAWPSEPEHEWCPPGHGDIYTALLTSGMLETLLSKGYEFAFVSNADNLGAVVEPTILGWVAASALPFAMEVTARTEADRKGGHLARRRDGGLVLREVAQCPEAELERFQDIERYRYFNTNNLWLHLPSLQKLLDQREGVMGLPLIRNEKTVDPRDPASPKVVQLETAMGAAVGVIDGARALDVPRTRMAPVKTTGDLLGVRSDAFDLTPDFRVVLAPEREGRAIVVDLDSAYYKRIDDFEQRFSHGAPSLVHCRRLAVRGDVHFGRDVVCEGDVRVENPGPEPRFLDDGTRLSG